MKKKPLTAEERDELLGRRLTKAMSTAQIGTCPGLEDIAALIDGALAGAARVGVLQHLAACDRCFEVFNASQELLDDELQQSTGRRFMFPAAFAAAAVLVVAVSLTLWNKAPQQQTMTASVVNRAEPVSVPSLPNNPKNETVKPHGAPAHNLLASATASAVTLQPKDGSKLQPETFSRSSSHLYGFSGVSSTGKLAFHLGTFSIDLEIMLQSSDREGAVDFLKQMAQMCDGRPVAVRLTEIAAKLERGDAMKPFIGCTEGLVDTFSEANDRFLYLFGVWVEGGRISTVNDNKGYVKDKQLTYVKGVAKELQLPVGVGKALDEIEAVTKKGEFTENDFQVMKRAFEDIEGML